MKTIANGFNNPVNQPLPGGSTVGGIAGDVPICDEFLNTEIIDMRSFCQARAEAAHSSKRQAVGSAFNFRFPHRSLCSPGCRGHSHPESVASSLTPDGRRAHSGGKGTCRTDPSAKSLV